jgi:hypothetical protein
MPSSGTLRRVALVRTNVTEELIASIIRVTRIGKLVSKLAVFFRSLFRMLVTVNVPSLPFSCHPENGGDTFLRNVGSYKSTRRNIPEDNILQIILILSEIFYLRIKYNIFPHLRLCLPCGPFPSGYPTVSTRTVWT